MKTIYILFVNDELRIFEKATTSKERLIEHIEHLIEKRSVTVRNPEMLQHLKKANIPAVLVGSELNEILTNCYILTDLD